MKESVILEDGKYIVIEDLHNGQFECLRYGEGWRNLVGDGMVLSMFYKIKELEGALVQIHEEIFNGDKDTDKIIRIINSVID